MPQLPIYERTQAPTVNGPSYQSAPDVTAPFNTFANVLQEAADAHKKRADQDALASASDQLATDKLKWYQELERRKLAAGGDDPLFAATYTAEFNDFMRGKLDDPKVANSRVALKTLKDGYAQIGAELGRRAIDAENVSRIEYRVRKRTDSIQTSASLVAQDPTQYTSELERQRSMIDADEVGPERRGAMLTAAEKHIADAAVLSATTKDPIGFTAAFGSVTAGKKIDGTPIGGATELPALKPVGEAGFGPAVKRVLANEGGFKLWGPQQGGATNLGITQDTLERVRKDNPLLPLTVKGLTQAQAQDIYKKYYWDANRLDQYPPAFAQFAMDTVVQHGEGPRLIAESGGSLDKLYSLRAKYVRSVAATRAKAGDPELQDAIPGIQRRIDATYEEAKGLEATPSMVLSRASPEDFKQYAADLPDGVREAFMALDPRQRIAYLQRAEGLAGQLRATKRAEVQNRVADISASAIVSNTPLDLPSPADYTLAYGPEAETRYRQDEALVASKKTVRNQAGMSAAERRAAVSTFMPNVGSPTAAAAVPNWREQDARNQDLTNQWQKNPVEMAISTGGTKPFVISQGSKDPMAEVAVQVRQRINDMQTVIARQEISSPQYLTGDEKKLLKDLVFNPDKPASQVLSFTRAFGPATDSQVAYSIIGEMSENDPGFRQGMMIAYNGQASINRPGAFKSLLGAKPTLLETSDETATKVFEGVRLLAPDGQEKDRSRKRFDIGPPEAFRTEVISTYGDAFRYGPNGNMAKYAVDQNMEAVMAHYAASMVRAGYIGYDKSTGVDKDQLKKSMAAVIGEPIDVGGQKALAPRGWDGGFARDTLNSQLRRMSTDSGGLVDPESVNLVSMGDGLYGVSAGATPLADRSGQPFVIDIYRSPLEEKLVAAEAATGKATADAAAVALDPRTRTGLIAPVGTPLASTKRTKQGDIGGR